MKLISNKSKINSTWIDICLINIMELTQEIFNKLTELKNSKCKKERIHSNALLLLNKGKSIQEVAEIFNVTQRSVYVWIKKLKNEVKE